MLLIKIGILTLVVDNISCGGKGTRTLVIEITYVITESQVTTTLGSPSCEGGSEILGVDIFGLFAAKDFRAGECVYKYWCHSWSSLTKALRTDHHGVNLDDASILAMVAPIRPAIPC